MNKDLTKLEKNSISKNVKYFRHKLGISQDRLSKLSDLSLTTVVNVESGQNKNPTVYTVACLAKALNVSVDDLIK